jgi:hypothetical protein
MPSPDTLTAVYKDLADWHERQNQPKLRDQFLVLAADAAHGAGRDNEAERLRAHLLRLNPHHMLRPFGSFAEALCSPDVQSYVNELRRTYPPQAAQKMHEKVQSRSSLGTGSEEEVANPALETLRVYEDPEETQPPAPPLPRATALPPPTVGVPKPAQRPARPAAPPQPPTRSTALPPPRVAFPPPRTSAAPPAPARPPRVVPERAPVATPPREPVPVPVRDSSPDPEEAATGSWLSTGLFVLLLLAGVALTVYSLIRPLVPFGWR